MSDDELDALKVRVKNLEHVVREMWWAIRPQAKHADIALFEREREAGTAFLGELRQGHIAHEEPKQNADSHPVR
jgi:hypothetical protein